MTKQHRIGIDIGGTNIKIGIVDQNNHIIKKRSIKTEVPLGWQTIISNMAKAVDVLLAEADLKISECISIGIDCPGVVDPHTGMVIFNGNLGWDHVPLTAELGKYFDIPIKASNDANCAALGEALAGGAKGCSDVVMITVGTGIGGGVIIGGKVFEGGLGGAELGHTVLVVGGEQCTCGRKGCFEAYSSATALIRDAKKAARSHPDSLMYTMCSGEMDKMNGEIPFEAAKKGDKIAKDVIDRYIMYLGEGLVDMINIFRPEKVLIGGGISNQGDHLMGPLNEYVRKYTFAGDRIPIPMIVKAILGNDAGIIGAANL